MSAGASSLSTQQKLLMVGAAFVWLVVALTSHYRFRLAAKAPVTLHIEATPSRVKLRINLKKHAAGRYVTTPIKLRVPPGNHRIKISRTGYVSHIMTVQGDSGDTFKLNDIVLESNPRLAFRPVAIVTPEGAAEMHFSIDDGFVEDVTPATIDDLLEDETHTLEVYPNWPEKKGAHKCRFDGKTVQDDDTLTIMASPKGHIRVKGCQRLRVKRKK